MVCSPMYHTVSIRFASGTLLAGGSLAILSRFHAATALDTLRRHRPTTAFLVPTHLQRILQSPDLGPDETFDSLRLLAHAGAPCPDTVKRAIMERVRPGGVWEFYGSTEAQFTVCPPEDWLERPGTVGRARPGRRLHIAPVPTPTPTTTSTTPPPTSAADAVGTIWCDMPRLRPLQLLGEPRGHRRRLERDGVHRRRPRPPRYGRLPLPDRPAPRPHHQRGRQRVSRRGRERPGRRRRHRRGGRLRPARRAVGPEGLRRLRRRRPSPRRRPRRPCGPPPRPASPRTSGPSRTSPPTDLPHTATGKLIRRAVPEHLAAG